MLHELEGLMIPPEAAHALVSPPRPCPPPSLSRPPPRLQLQSADAPQQLPPPTHPAQSIKHRLDDRVAACIAKHRLYALS